MKKKLLFLSIALILFLNLDLIAQNWIVGGNALGAGGGSLGSNNNQPVIFETNNTERTRLTPNGRWAIGLTNPAAKVHIRSGAALNPFRVDIAGTTAFLVNGSNSRIGIGTTGPLARLHINSATGEDALRVQVNGATKLWVNNNGGVSVGSAFTPPSNGLFVSGDAGIGTSSPAAKLHIVGGSDASLTGGGYIVTGNTTGANVAIDENEIMARNNGAASTLFLNHQGGDVLIDDLFAGSHVGIGTGSVGSFKLKVSHGSFGFNIENHSNGNDWEQVILTSNLELYFNGAFRGSFSSTNGVYSAVSDERLKSNVQAMSAVLPKINQLKPVTYQFKNTSDQTAYGGFIAQEVQKVFPSLVTHNVNAERGLDLYSLDYTGFGVIAIKGIQELQQTIQEQQKKITTLEDRITKLEAVINSISKGNANASSKQIAGAALQQNQPNPFNQNTIIRYTLPAGTNAQIMIYDATGRLVKTLQATESGQSRINASELNPGTYTYALIANGNVIASKTMVLLK
jgi:hypothetical protein